MSAVDPNLVDRIRERLAKVLESVVHILPPDWQKRGIYEDAIVRLRTRQPVQVSDRYYSEHLSLAMQHEGVAPGDPRYVVILYSLESAAER